MKNGELTIYRTNSGVPKIVMTIYDDSSRNTFVEAHINLDDFTKAVTGLSGVPIKLETYRLDVVGKKQESEDLAVIISADSDIRNDIKEYANFLERNEMSLIDTKAGWRINPYLGSQKSVVKNQDGTITLNVKKYRYK